MIFWHPNGWTIYQVLEKYIREILKKNDYLEIKTPQAVDKSLWEKSGHWEKYGENMYTSETPDEKVFAIKPMNCPGHIQVFNQGLKSYRDLPLRITEFGKVHRYEPSGALHGLLRVRAFTQDDAHIFCSEDQITSECLNVTNLILEIYKDLGFENVILKYSDRPEKRVGEDHIWDKSESALLTAIKKTNLEYTINKGEGAFYGPKIEFVLRDAIGRDWQCGTLQVDFVLPERLDASYIGEDGKKYRPVMLHRAILGSFERFIGILIENYSGRLPAWLSPIQVALATINSNCINYAEELANDLKKINIKCITDIRNEKLNYKIRELSNQKINFIGIIGDKEVENKQVALRTLGTKNQDVLSVEDFIKKIKISCRIT